MTAKHNLAICASLLMLGTAASAQRAMLSDNTTFWVAAATASPPGTNSPNCGAAASPCLTKQGAVNSALRIDAMNYVVTIADPSCADSTPLVVTSPIIGAAGIAVVGNLESPCSVVSSNDGNALDFSWVQNVMLTGLNPSSTGGPNGNGVRAGPGSYITYGPGMNFGSAGLARSFADSGRIVYGADYTISGTSVEVDHFINGGVIGGDGRTATCASGHAVSGQWSAGGGGGLASYTNTTFVGCSNVARKYLVHFLASIKSGTLLPGANGTNAGGNADDNIGAGQLTADGFYIGATGAITTSSGAMRFTNGDGSIVIQNPYISKSPGGSCTPSSLC